MKQKKWPCILGILLALVLEFIGTSSGPGSFRRVGGVCIGLGAALFSLCINRLYRLSYEKEFPELVHQEKSEYQDERNSLIRNRAKAKSADIIQWVIFAIACMVFFADGPLWITLSLIGAYALRYCLEWYYLGRYQKEM